MAALCPSENGEKALALVPLARHDYDRFMDLPLPGTRIHHLIQFPASPLVVAAMSLALFTSAHSAPNEIVEVMTVHESQAKQLTIRILRNLKPLEALLREQPDGSEHLPPELRPQVTEKLRENENLLVKIELHHAQAERLRLETYPKGQPPPSVREILVNLSKFEKLARGQFERFRILAGAPMIISIDERAGVRFSGEAEIGLGSNKATTFVGGVEVAQTDISRSLIRTRLMSEITPKDKISVEILRNEEVHFTPSTRTNGEIRYDRRASRALKFHAGAEITGFKDDSNRNAEYGDSEFEIGGTYNSSRKFRAKGFARFQSRSFDNIDDADFGDRRLQGELSGKSSGADWKIKGYSTRHDADVDTEDSDKGKVSGQIGIVSGKDRRLSIELYVEGAEFDRDDDTRTFSKRGARLESRGGSGSGTKRTSYLAFDRREHDVNEDRDYKQYKIGIKSFSFDTQNGSQRNSLTALYRNFVGEGSRAFLDFAEGRWDRSTQSLSSSGAGTFLKTSHFFRWYFDDGDIERNAELNQYAWFGVAVSRKNPLRVGPFVAGDTDLITEEDVTDPVTGEELGTFDSPTNTVRYGIKGDAKISAGKIRGGFSGRVERLKLYNVDDSPTTNRLELSGDLEVPLTDVLTGSVRGQYYKTGSDDPGTVETSEIDLLFSLIYTFDRPNTPRSGRSITP